MNLPDVRLHRLNKLILGFGGDLETVGYSAAVTTERPLWVRHDHAPGTLVGVTLWQDQRTPFDVTRMVLVPVGSDRQ